MGRKKREQNYLDRIPKRTEGLSWEQGEEGIVILLVENTGVFNRIAQKLFKRPKYTKVHMDKYGSFLWPLMDGKRTVSDLARLQKDAFGEEVEPLYPRIVKYFQIVESYRFIEFKNCWMWESAV